MSDNLENFLVDVSSNPQQLSRFNENPSDATAKTPLSEGEKAAVLSGDSQAIADALGSTGYSLGLGIDVITPSKAPSRRKVPVRKKTPARKKTPPKKGPARKKAPAKKQSPKKPARRAPAKRAPAKRAPAKRAPAKRTPVRKSSRRPASRKKR